MRGKLNGDAGAHVQHGGAASPRKTRFAARKTPGGRGASGSKTRCTTLRASHAPPLRATPLPPRMHLWIILSCLPRCDSSCGLRFRLAYACGGRRARLARACCAAARIAPSNALYSVLRRDVFSAWRERFFSPSFALLAALMPVAWRAGAATRAPLALSASRLPTAAIYARTHRARPYLAMRAALARQKKALRSVTRVQQHSINYSAVSLLWRARGMLICCMTYKDDKTRINRRERTSRCSHNYISGAGAIPRRYLHAL